MAKEKPKSTKSKSWNEDFDNLSDCEVLEKLISSVVSKRSAADVAKDLLEEFGSFSRVIDASPRELKRVEGMSDAACSAVTLLPLFWRKYNTSNVKKGTSFASFDELARFVSNCMIGYKNEVLLVLCFDEKSKLISWKTIHEGSIHSLDISVRKIVSYAVSTEASRVVVAHNHVDGILHPSRADLDSTEMLFDVLANMGITLVDHIITCNGEYLSLAKFRGVK
ncbi:MAG: hypothetical protein E7473_07805 [Ruminococcaceae bacterium]|nr:hypothetical protein [Oscillospiraceae bacterium]